MKHTIKKLFFRIAYGLLKISRLAVSGNGFIFAVLPGRYDLLPLIKSYIYDLQRYAGHAVFTERPDNLQQLRSRITASYHVIEKGLSLKEPRPGFGLENIHHLIDLIEHYFNLGYPKDESQVASALRVLSSYLNYHRTLGLAQPELEIKVKSLIALIETKSCDGGVLSPESGLLRKNRFKEFVDLAYSRHSIRNFGGTPVDIDLIMSAIEVAQRSPSVCNRQASRVYLLKDRKVIRDVLECQNGNRGFGHLSDKLLVITSNLKSFYHPGERNQAFIDGGIFGMSLVYALHAQGLGTCTLNWSAVMEQDQALRQVLPVRDEEVVIFLIAVGHIPDRLKVPVSHRLPLGEVVTVI